MIRLPSPFRGSSSPPSAPSAPAGRWIRRAALLAALVLPAFVRAESVYVTDELRLGLYATEQTEGRAVKTLVSGAKLDILERALMSIRVRTEDGDEGWVKTAYVVPTEPARRRVAALESAQQTLTAELEAARAALDDARARIGSLETTLDETNARIGRLPELEAENANLRAELAGFADSVRLQWLMIAAALAFAAGAFAGYRWLDRRVRRKFGGLKIY